MLFSQLSRMEIKAVGRKRLTCGNVFIDSFPTCNVSRKSAKVSPVLFQGANASALEKEIGPEQFPVNEHYFGLVNVCTSADTTACVCHNPPPLIALRFLCYYACTCDLACSGFPPSSATPATATLCCRPCTSVGPSGKRCWHTK